jgi:hypothetical protein
VFGERIDAHAMADLAHPGLRHAVCVFPRRPGPAAGAGPISLVFDQPGFKSTPRWWEWVYNTNAVRNTCFASRKGLRYWHGKTGAEYSRQFSK